MYNPIFSGFQTVDMSQRRVKIGKRLTPSDVHVDRLNSALLHAYMQEAKNFVAGKVFPVVGSPERSNYYPQYDKAHLMKSQLDVRAPGAVSKEVLLATDNTGNYWIPVVAGNIPIDRQTQANAEAPYDPIQDATKVLAQQALLWKEVDWATQFFTTGKWANDVTPSTLWSAANSDPLGDLETGMKTIAQNTGREPNKLVLGRSVWSILKNHDEVVGRLDRGQTSGPAQASLDALAALIGVDEVLVMNGVRNTADLGQTATMAFIGDKDALLLHVAPSPGRFIASAGYAFSWTGYLGANASGGSITSWFSPDRKCDLAEIELAVQHKLVGSDLGYFLSAAVT
jgi:hypothetical protein